MAGDFFSTHATSEVGTRCLVADASIASTLPHAAGATKTHHSHFFLAAFI
jgi:hypothetical protein